MRRNKSVKQSRRVVSQRYMRAAPVPIGTQLWVPHEALVWARAEVLDQDNTLLTVKLLDSGERAQIDLGFQEIHPLNPNVCPDMTGMHHIHEPGILHNLAERFKAGTHPLAYTYMGTVLLAVNPLQTIPTPSMEVFQNQTQDPENPHPYALAEFAYQQLCLGPQESLSGDQSIVISGESGAGKTETAKIILNYLSSRCADTTNASTLNVKLIESSPLLEAFGNAQTVRNPNSSRFGKFMKLLLPSPEYRLVGAHIETYLLEKSRIVFQNPGERNYHIFYQALAGGALEPYLHSKESSAYRILGAGQSSPLVIPDHEQFSQTLRAFSACGISQDSLGAIWKVLAAVMLLANTNLAVEDSAEGAVAVLEQPHEVDHIANVLGVPPTALQEVLTERKVVTRGEEYRIRLTQQDAEYARDAIAKALYESAFQFVIDNVNTVLGVQAADHAFIGVLDIFGFENFPSNSLEQFFINFANESLQNTFNQQIFTAEMQLYQEENIDCKITNVPSNNECVELLAAKPDGILLSLDNACRQPKPSDVNFCAKVHEVHARHPFLNKTHPKDRQFKFIVRHYAGAVCYTTADWITKNNDSIPDTWETCLGSSTDLVVASMSRSNSSPSGFRKPTIATTFAKSMTSLADTLNATRCAFIRCVKPNAEMAPKVFDRPYVVQQLRSLGILQSCEVLKVGLPFRIKYSELKHALADAASVADELFRNEPEEVHIAALLYAFNVPQDVYRLGRTRVFFKAGQIGVLQSILHTNMEEQGPVIVERLRTALEIRKEAETVANRADAMVNELVLLLAGTRFMLESFQQQIPATGGGEGNFLQTKSMIRKAELANTDTHDRIKRAEQKLQKLQTTDQELHTSSISSAFKTANELLDEMRAKSQQVEKLVKNARGIERMLDDTDTEQCVIVMWEKLSQIEQGITQARTLAKLAHEKAIRCQLEQTKAYIAQLSNLRDGASASTTEGAEMVQSALSSIQRSNVYADQLRALVEEIQVLHEQVQGADSKQQGICDRAQHEIVDAQKQRAAAQARKQAAEEEAARAATATNATTTAAATVPSFTSLPPVPSASPIVPTMPAMPPPAVPNATPSSAPVKPPRAGVQALELSSPVAELPTDLPPTKPSRANLSPGFSSRAPEMSAADRRSRGMSTRLKGFDLGALQASLQQAPEVSPQMERLTETAEEDDNGEEVGAETDDGLPPGWESYVDAESNEVYYYNTLTYTTQWEKPTVPASSNYVSQTSGEYLEQESPNTVVYSEQFRQTTTRAVPPSRKRIAIAEMEELGVTPKEGMLMKCTRYLGLWKSRYFVLEGNFLHYYPSQSHVGGSKRKSLELTLGTVTAFTDTECCFTVRNQKENWVLIAQDEDLMRDWISAINSHVHMEHLRTTSLQVDPFWERGEIGKFCYQVSTRLTAPVGIRSLPELKGPRTGAALVPGEMIECVQRLVLDGTTHVRLADDRGWVFERHPQEYYPVLVHREGTWTEIDAVYKYSDSAMKPLGIRFGPGVDSQGTGEAVLPGDAIHVSERLVLDDSSSQCYLKLSDGRGWVFLLHPTHGTTLFELLER